MKIATITKRDPLIETRIYRDFHTVGKMLVERRLSDEEIQNLFKAVEKGYSDSGQNRTMIGKGKDVVTDVASAINRAYQGVADKISKSGPVSGFDVAVDKLTDKLKSAAGGESGPVMNAIYKYREFAKKHPIMQGAIYAGLIALTGLSGAGLGGAALLGGIKAFDKMLLGNKASSALWSGFVTGATAYGVSKLAQAYANSQTPQGGAGADADQVYQGAGGTAQGGAGAGADYTVKAGDTLSDIAKANNVSVDELMRANPGITNPDVIRAGQNINIPAETGSSVYQGGVGTAADTAAKVKSGAYSPPGAGGGNVEYLQPVSVPPPPPPPEAVAQTARAATAAPDAGEVINALNQKEQLALARDLAKKMGIQGSNLNFTAQGTVPTVINGQPVPMDLLSPTQQRLVQVARSMSSQMRESVRLVRPLPLRHLVDKESTLWHWRLDESLDRRRGGVHFNRRGIGHVFQLIEQQLVELDVKGARAQDVMARRGKASQRPAATIAKPAAGAPPAATPAAQPGQRIEPTFNPAAAAPTAPAPQAAAEPPEYLRPTRPGAPVQQPAKPGLMSRIGQGLQTFGRQLTTKVTAEKLNTNWKVAGSPTDSDKLFYFLIQQGVPDAVARQVYGDLKLQPPAAAAGTDTTSTGSVPYAPPADSDSAAAGTGTGTKTAGAAGAATSSTASGSSQSAKMTADDIVGQIKPIWDKITANQDNPIGAPAVKQLIKSMWMATGGTKVAESGRTNKKRVDENVRWAIDHVRQRQKMLDGQRRS